MKIFDALSYLSKLRQLIYAVATGERKGFEDELQRQVADLAKNEFGVELDEDSFSG